MLEKLTNLNFKKNKKKKVQRRGYDNCTYDLLRWTV